MDPSFVDKFLHCIYVDDLTTGASTVNDCYEFYLKAKMRLAEAGFNLRKFVTNSMSLLEKIACNEEQMTKKTLGDKELPTEHKLLGVYWNPKNDQLHFDTKAVCEYLEGLSPTRRNIVGVAARVYDPLGILSPLTISLKIFFQLLCKAKLAWDDPLTEELSL